MELLANILDARGKSHANSLPVTGRCDRDGSIVEFPLRVIRDPINSH